MESTSLYPNTARATVRALPELFGSYKPLGIQGRKPVLGSVFEERTVKLAASTLGFQLLEALFGVEWLESRYKGSSESGTERIDFDAVVIDLIAACIVRGRYVG